MLSYRKVLFIQFSDLADHIVDERFAEFDEVFRLVKQILKFESDLRFAMEDGALQGYHIRCRFPLVHAEKFKVPAEVEDIESLLVFSVEQGGAKTRAASDHLPEFRLAHDLLEEDEIQHLRHVYTGIEHIHGNGDLRKFLRV